MIIELTWEQRRALLRALKPGASFAPPGSFDGTFTVEDTGLVFKLQQEVNAQPEIPEGQTSRVGDTESV